jgi:hypothetical protein
MGEGQQAAVLTRRASARCGKGTQHASNWHVPTLPLPPTPFPAGESDSVLRLIVATPACCLVEHGVFDIPVEPLAIAALHLTRVFHCRCPFLPCSCACRTAGQCAAPD